MRSGRDDGAVKRSTTARTLQDMGDIDDRLRMRLCETDIGWPLEEMWGHWRAAGLRGNARGGSIRSGATSAISTRCLIQPGQALGGQVEDEHDSASCLTADARYRPRPR